MAVVNYKERTLIMKNKLLKWTALFLCLFPSGVLAAAASESEGAEDWMTQEFSAHSVRRVVIENDKGDVDVSASPDGAPSLISFQRSCPPEEYGVDITSTGTTINIRGKKPSEFSASGRETNFRLSVPKETEVDVKVGMGNVKVSDIIGRMAFSMGSGNMDFVWSRLFPSSVRMEVGQGNAILRMPEGVHVKSLLEGPPFFFRQTSMAPTPPDSMEESEFLTLSGGFGMGSVTVQKTTESGARL